MATETSGAVPSTTDVRLEPASRIARVTQICAAPGERMPASTNGQTPARWRPRLGASAATATSATTVPVPTQISDARCTSSCRLSPLRRPMLIPPKSSADSAARTIAVNATPVRLPRASGA
jgi:hypothetical protein